MFISTTYGGPTVLYTLLPGMAFHFISEDTRAIAGIELCAKNFLRTGVALLGARITAEELSHLTVGSVTVLVTGVFATVAFCGASAAAALALVIDKKALREQALLAIIVTVTALSTISMVLYPLLCELLGFEGPKAGFLLGGTIHDAAHTPKTVNPFTQIPLFLVGFVVLSGLNVAGFVPVAVSDTLAKASQLLILIVMGALGIKTSLGKLKAVGWAPIVLMPLNTVFLFEWVLAGILLVG